MTAIEYGGGPNLAERRKFSNLKTGSHIPGYKGFCPQYKYKNGKTYANLTAECAQKLPYYNGPINNIQPVEHPGSSHASSQFAAPSASAAVANTATSERFNLRRDPHLPVANGDNKYFEKMMPGYSGDVPRWPYKFGATYRNICDEASASLVREWDRTAWKAADRQRASSMFPRLRARFESRSSAAAVTAAQDQHRDHMNRWTDTTTREVRRRANHGHPEEVRGATEPPIPGYTGYVPRTPCTDIALGLRYHDGAAKGFQAFHGAVTQHFNRLSMSSSAPLSNGVGVPGGNGVSSERGGGGGGGSGSDPSKASRRIFHQDGMIPLYTGHMHVIKDKYGRTYGDTTRSLDVCNHPCVSFGASTARDKGAVSRQPSSDQKQLIPV